MNVYFINTRRVQKVTSGRLPKIENATNRAWTNFIRKSRKYTIFWHNRQNEIDKFLNEKWASRCHQHRIIWPLFWRTATQLVWPLHHLISRRNNNSQVIVSGRVWKSQKTVNWTIPADRLRYAFFGCGSPFSLNTFDCSLLLSS